MKDAFTNFTSLKSRKVSPVLDKDTNLVSDKEAKAERWKEHFEQLLNNHPVPSPDLPESLADDQDQACSEPCLAEVHAAVQRLKNGKALDLCGITAEMLKLSSIHGTQWLTNVIKQAWNS